MKKFKTMGKNWLTVFLLLFILTSGKIEVSSGVHRYYVKSHSNDTCGTGAASKLECETISEYAKWTNVTNSTTFVFLPGKHWLDKRFDLVGLSKIQLISNASLDQSEAKNDSVLVEIECVNESGFKFEHVTNLSIVGLTFTKCGMNNVYKNSITESVVSGLFFNSISNLNMSHVIVQNTTGYGIFLNNVYGVSAIRNSTFQYSRNSADCRGGNAALYYQDCENNSGVMLLIKHSRFLYGKFTAGNTSNSPSPGLVLYLNCRNVTIHIYGAELKGNDGYREELKHSFDADTAGNVFGGNMAIVVHRKHAFINITKSNFTEGTAFFGGGMFVQYSHRRTCKNNLLIENCVFRNNTAHVNGGGLYFEMNHTQDTSSENECNHTENSYQLKLSNTEFTKNNVQTNKDAGIALTLTYFYGQQYFTGSYGKYSTLIDQCSFQYSMKLQEGEVYSSGSAALYTSQQFGRLVIRNSNFTNNNVTGLAAFRSLINFQGEVNIANNRGYDGGGIILCEASYFIMSTYAVLNISFNNATSSGGGIFAESRCVQVQPLCFYQIEQANDTLDDDYFNTTYIILSHNRAEFAGSQLYGGTVDECHIPHINQDIFHSLFHVHHNDSDISSISSDPLNVCFCNSNLPDCNKTDKSLDGSIYSGELFDLSLVIVGQYDGAVPGSVELTLHDEVGQKSLVDSNTFKILPNRCSNYNITIYTQADAVSVQFEVKNVHANYKLNLKSVKLHVTMKPSPIGFEATGLENPVYRCVSSKMLDIHNENFRCVIKDNRSVIERPSPYWLGWDDKGFVLYNFCPLDNCKHYRSDINTDNFTFHQDDQCEHNHSGTLCGQCKDNLSLAIGSSRCLDCTHITLMKTVGISLGLALVGLLGIFVLMLLDITVTQGTMSGFLFYVNLFYVFRATLFPLAADTSLTHLHSPYTGFVSFMNLVLTYNSCYYNGLDICGHSWIQFLMAFYLWTITGIFIWLCKRFSWLASHITKNTIPVLATVILLSYTTINITIIYSLTFARLKYPGPGGKYNITKVVLLYDGTVDYLGPKHVPLLIVGFILGTLSILFTLLLLCVQPLQRFSHLKPFRWVNKLKPLLDAYTCPHIIKPRCRFWNGYLLLIRVTLYLFFMTQTSGNHHKTIAVSINVACLIILSTSWSFGGVYTKPHLNVLSSSYFLNMGVLSLLALYYHPEKYADGHGINSNGMMRAAIVSLTITIFTFFLTIAYHVYTQIRRSACWRHIVRKIYSRYRRDSLLYQPMEGYTSGGEESECPSDQDPVPANKVPPAPRGPEDKIYSAPPCGNQYREPQLMDFDSLKSL